MTRHTIPAASQITATRSPPGLRRLCPLLLRRITGGGDGLSTLIYPDPPPPPPPYPIV